jgi:hypothetical protein
MPLSNGDRLGIESGVLTGAALILAVVGAIVALAAYLVSIRVPDLTAKISWGEQSATDIVTFPLSKQSQAVAPLIELAPGKQLTGQIRLNNAGRYPARTPVVRLELQGVRHVDASKQGTGWAVMDKTADGDPLRIQWTGLDMTIHGGFGHNLPGLDLLGAAVDPKAKNVIAIDLAADGWRSPRQIHLQVKTSGP